MQEIIFLTGNLDYNITLDPSSWLFDDRKVDLDTYFDQPQNEQTQPKIKNQDLRKNDHYSLGVPFQPYLHNAAPRPKAHTLMIETRNQETYNIPLEQARTAILAFTKDGKFLNDDGPAHFYYGDGSNQNHPITHIAKLTVR